MYRLVEEQNNTKQSIFVKRQHQQLNSEKFFASEVAAACGGGGRRASTGGVHSPPRLLPYDELEMDERHRQEEKLRIRSKLSGEYPPSPRQHESELDSSSQSVNSSCTVSNSGRRRTIAHLEMPQQQQQPTGGLPPPHPPPPGRRRKSKPWQTDVILNRFSGTTGSGAATTTNSSGTGQGRNLTGSSSTQKSTWGWKQRMQERKAVFGNVAVPEQSFDDEDALVEEDDDMSSKGGQNEQAIREEAVELLRSKGFHNFQGILQQQYDDDLESVGGSVRAAGASSPTFLSPLASPTPVSSAIKQHKLRLEEIKSLREKILRHQEMERMDSTDSMPDVNANVAAAADTGATGGEEKQGEEEEGEPQQPPNDQPTPPPCEPSNSTTATTDPVQPEQLNVDTTVTTSRSSAMYDDNLDAVKAWKVIKELKVRLLDVETDDYYILETIGRKGLDSPSCAKIVFDETAFDRHKLRDAVEKRVSLVFTGDHKIVINGVVQGREDDDEEGQDEYQESEGSDAAQQNEDEEKEQEKLPDIRSPELRERLSGSFLAFEALLQARKQAALADDDWTECSMSVVETPSARNAPGMIPSMKFETPVGDADDQSCWTEYTLDVDDDDDDDNQAGEQDNRRLSVDTAHSQATAPTREQSGCQTDMPRTVKRSNTQKASSNSNNEWDEYTFAEVTVQDEPTAALAPFRLPGQAQMPVQSRRQDQDDQSYMELTVRGDDTPFSPLQPGVGADDQSYMEMTVHESPPTRQPLQRRGGGDDEKSYMEVTIQDGQPNFKEMVSPDLTSPHLSSMLSSRMFADMELPNELRHQQPQQRSIDEQNHDSYPTITIGHDDDELTQITFDNTMMDVGSASQDHHHHAVHYLDSSTKTKESYRTATTVADAPDLPSIVGSQHTDITRDTTVSDDGSSHQDGASFKSCVSSESSQFVAELLRRDIWSPDSAVVRSALEKLEQEASKGVHERSNIVKYGGLLAILRSMDMKPDQAPIQMAACAALEKMAIDATTQVAIGEVGGIPAIAHAMELHVDNVHLQQTACRALSALTRHRDDNVASSCKDPLQAEGVVALVTSSMTKHPEDPEIQAHSFGALANLCLDNQERLRELKQSGGLGTMTMALQVPWANKTDQHEAISTLSILLRSLAGLEQR
ncbi:expressed unknown protein [Seminavis robusta]|uniref:Uncharacterized protein n=1 Tax=Seminavis robusta TaxID=568900 RepID=A0A9N8E0X3_9STRA|nr:expressed unknown protein [Seminavis robusta]|eukprot:Sro513_g157780.1 n/a (1145) ;mRNA; f:15881-19315